MSFMRTTLGGRAVSVRGGTRPAFGHRAGEVERCNRGRQWLSGAGRALQTVVLAMLLWAGGVTLATACNWNLTFTSIGQSQSLNTQSCNAMVLGPDWGGLHRVSGTDAFSDYGVGADDANNGAPQAENVTGANGGVYEFQYDISNSFAQIKLITPPSSSPDSFKLYSYFGPNHPPSNAFATTENNFTMTVSLGPAVTGLSPTSGPTNGGTSVTIMGTNLSGATAVKFGAANAVAYSVLSPTSIVAMAPSASAGVVDVTVTTPAGTSAISASDRYTYLPAPTVTGLSPSSGPTGGGTTVAVTGTGFTATSTIKFGSATAAGVVFNSATSLTVIAPAGTGTVDVTVTTDGGTSAISAADQYTYLPAPTVSGVSPSSGPQAGGTSVTLTGTSFVGATAVTFGGTPATFTVVDATTIMTTAPAGAGMVDIRVTTPGGTSAVSAADQFTYLPPPTVTSIGPASGPAGGGTSVTITGTGFTGVSAVTFGGSPASSFTFNSATSITATAPAGAGMVNVRVTTPTGTSAANAASQFTYDPAPAVTGIAPASGPAAGGTTVVITGTNLSGASAVRFGASSATGYTVNSATQITATAPAGGPGVVNVTVTTPGGTSAPGATDQYTYLAAPTVTSVNPGSGPTGGGTSVTIAGTSFVGVSAVTFGGSPASFAVNSPTSITATAPAGTGTVDIQVTTSGGISAAGQYTYLAAPAVTSISPGSGTTAGGTIVTITGTGFTGVSAVTFGATPASSFTLNSPTSITATAPAGTGIVDIRVTTPGGTSAAGASAQFTYVASPEVTGLSPSAGPASGGTLVTITGSNFSGATAVTFGATAATSVTVISSTSISAIAPAGSGTVNVTVATAVGSSPPALANQFAYIAAPVVASVSPGSGPAGGGTAVTISGSGFTGATVVSFGGTPATAYAVNSDTSITATSPAGTGTVDIRVTTAGGTSAVSAGDRFAYGSANIVLTPGSGALPDAMVLEAYSTVVTASGHTGALVYSLTSGALPAGMVLNASTGELTGPINAGAEGDYSFTISVVDAASNTGSASVTLKVIGRAVTAENKTVTVPTGSTPVPVNLTEGATGGPFDRGSVVAVEPAIAGTARISGAAVAAAGGSYSGIYLHFVPNPQFSGTAVVTFTLQGALGTSNAATVSYALSVNPVAVEDYFSGLTQTFLTTRGSMLAGAVDVPGLQSRRGAAGAQMPGTISLAPNGNSIAMNFAASTLAASAAANAAEGMAMMPVDDGGLNFWIDGTAALHVRTSSGTDHWGSLAVISAGADVLLNEDLLVGVALHTDWMDDITAASRAVGQGLLVGPYVSAELGEGVFLDASLFYGRSWNEVSTSLFKGTFQTDRVLAKLRLEGQWALSEALAFRPSVNAFYLRENSGAYAVADGLGNTATIGAFTLEQLRLSAGGVLQYTLAAGDDLTVVPFVGLQLGLSLNNGASSLFTTLSGGVDLMGVGDWTIGASVEAGLEQNGLRSISAKARVGLQF